MSLTSEATVTRTRVWVPAVARLLQMAPLPVAFVGMGISAYLSFVHFSGVPLYCEGAGGCHTVQASEYATLLGVPVALLGFVLYAGIFAAGLLALRGAGATAQVAPFLVFGLALSGVLYSAYLTWLELYRIYAICTWCVASACLLTVIFAAATAELVVSGRWREAGPPSD
jgi:uncharacterized membrane protein